MIRDVKFVRDEIGKDETDILKRWEVPLSTGQLRIMEKWKDYYTKEYGVFRTIHTTGE